MRMLFKQRLFSWFDSYDIYDEAGNVLFVVKGQPAWGHCLKVLDSAGRETGMVKERIFTWLPKFELYAGGRYLGCVSRDFSLFKPRYSVDCRGWRMEGDIFQWDYSVVSATGQPVATISKELFHWTDTYVIDVVYPPDALLVLMLALAVDAEKCSGNNP